MKVELCSYDSCTYCTSCASVCPKDSIRFTNNEEGFYKPTINKDTCIECAKCINSCHIISPLEKNNLIGLYAMWSLNNHTRCTSSSGGIFTELAREVLDLDGVVYGATWDDSLSLTHYRVSEHQDLFRLKGSKYVQSFIKGNYLQVRQDLSDGKYVLFVGTPCQVAGLYSFLGRNDTSKLLTCDFICHGVPSQKLFELYLKSINLSKSKVQDFRFRYLRGWGLQLSYLLKGSKQYKLLYGYKDFYLRAFSKGLMFMEACYNCQYSTLNRISDVTLADFWDIGKFSAFNYNSKKGVSMILTNSQKGNDIILELETKQKVFKESREAEEALKSNYNLSNKSIKPKEREAFIKDLESLGYKDIQKKYDLSPNIKDFLRPLKRKLNL